MSTQSSCYVASAPNNTAEDKYQTLFENVQGAAFLTTYAGKILEANQRSCDLLGYTWDELMQDHLKKFFPQNIDWVDIQDEIASRGGINLEADALRKDGSRVPVEVSASLFQLQKQPVMFVLIRDITERKNAEHKLRENEAKYRGLFEYATDGICVLDAHGTIVDVNSKLIDMIGFSKKELCGQNLFNIELLTGSSLPVVLQEFEQLLSQKTSKILSSEIRTKTGIILEVEISSFFLVRKNNDFDNFVLLIRDVTERNEITVHQRHEHEILRMLLDNIPDSVYFKDEHNRFTMVNQAKAIHSNVKPGDMVGKTDFDFMEHEEATRSFHDDTMIMQSGQAIISKTERHVLSNGLVKWTSVTKIPHFNAEGEIIGTMGISRDITDVQQAKEDLERSESRYRAVFENQSVAIAMTDEQGRIISWNSRVEELLQMVKNDLQFRAVHTLFPHDSWEKYVQDLDRLDVERGIPYETQIQRSDSSHCDVEVTQKKLYDSTHRFLGTTWIFSDISKQKIAEAEMRSQHMLLMALMDTIPDSIYFKDTQHRFVLVNKAKALHWNTTPKKMLGKTDFDFLPEDQARKAFEDDNTVLCEGKLIVNKIERISDANGVDRWFSVTKVPRFDKSGRVIGTLGISRDVTQFMRQQPEQE
ncbi:MAG: PAS domain S-box protein [Candidatus Thermoplasmatota archaeon]|nr:PAS domain S-box protein [Candidatus Thermoplasmatota archaeon]MBU1940834.1 PAS domain S-box protein [Candidatus Thermoplasmatota archaeon]